MDKQDIWGGQKKDLFIEVMYRTFDGIFYRVYDANNNDFAEINVHSGNIFIMIDGKVIYKGNIKNTHYLTGLEKLHYSDIVKTEIEKYYNDRVCVVEYL